MNHIVLRNRQRTRRVDRVLLRRIARTLVTELLGLDRCELGIHLVAGPEITQLNETFLRHRGPTDVIAFNHQDETGAPPPLPGTSSPPNAIPGHSTAPRPSLYGEVFICVDEAIRQARRFRVTWQAEVVRYLVHGLLHLTGHDDRTRRQQQAMKCEEERLLRELGGRLPLRRLGRTTGRRGNGPSTAGRVPCCSRSGRIC